VQYEQLIREAWRLTWERRFLWWLALFAGGPSTFVSTGGLRPDELAVPLQEVMASAPPELREVMPELLRWINQNMMILLAGATVLLILLLMMVVFSCAFKAALTRATLDITRQQPTSLGQAWPDGIPYLWRFVALSLLFGLLVGLAALILVGILTTIGMLSAGGNAIGPALGAILALPLSITTIVLAVIGSIIFPFAEREVVNHDLGVIDGLWAGWRLLRSRIRHSLLVWFINLVIGVAAGVVMGIAFIIVGFVLFVPGALLWWMVGPGLVTAGYLGLAAATTAALIFAMGAVSNAYQWTFWSLAYVRMVDGEPQAVGGQLPA
jgi:hypothetical protein